MSGKEAETAAFQIQQGAQYARPCASSIEQAAPLWQTSQAANIQKDMQEHKRVEPLNGTC
eukprot:scaffold82038_cov21-Tisochrysis_lutea.AAC.3